ncbi:MAG: MMPL family transporter [Deltaproteobacteria bacterium]|nr:MMPL family transporter [Deltaproteobacteria bacterium]
MSRFKLLVEAWFEKLGYFICRHRFKTLILMFMLIATLAFQMKNLTVDTSWEGMLHPDDPNRVEYNNFRDQFGQDRVIICTVKTPEIFTEKNLKKLKSLHHDLEKGVPHLDEVKSLVNARSTRGEEDTLIVEELLKDWPEKEIDLVALKKYALNNPVYLNDFISEDGQVAAIIVKPIASAKEADKEGADDLMDDFSDEAPVAEESPSVKPDVEPEQKSARRHFLSKEDNKEVVVAVRQILDRYRAPDFEIAIGGGPVSEEIYDHQIKLDMRFFSLIMFFIILFFLFLLFRRISGAIFPVVIVYSGLSSTMGVMALCKVSISPFSFVLPSFLTAVGIADAVHILAVFYRHYQNGNSKVDSIAFSLGHSGLAIVMTSLTTAAGLMSFSISELSAIGNLGIFASIGVMIALFYTVIMLPALLAIVPIKEKKMTTAGKGKKLMDRVLIATADFSSGNPIKIVVFSILLFIVSIAFTLDLKFSHHHKNTFPEDMTIRKDEEFMDKHLKGVLSIEVVLDTKKENGLYEPEILKRIDNLCEEIKQIKDGEIFIGKVRSMNDILKETNQALHENNPEFYTIPDEKSLVTQELFLFENSGSDDLERIVDSKFSKTRISFKIPWLEVLDTERLSDDIYDRFKTRFESLAEITVTGMSPLMGKAVSAAIRSMTRSYVVAAFVISIMMIVLVGNFKLGVISMIPNLLPIIVVMGIMGAFNVYIDMVALMICSIAIGLVVDDTMHFMYNYRKYYERFGDVRQAVRETFLTTGRAILITALVLAANFFVLLLATFTNTNKFGFFSGIVILIALLANFIVTPALMVLATRHLKIKKRVDFSERSAPLVGQMADQTVVPQTATLSGKISNRS